MKFLTLKKLSEEKGIPVSTLREFTKKESPLPHYTSPGGRKIRVSPEEFDTWYRENYRATSVQDTGDIDRIIDEALTAVGCR
jgi:hypothetical protein